MTVRKMRLCFKKKLGCCTQKGDIPNEMQFTE